MSSSPGGYVGEAATFRAWFSDGWEEGVPLALVENSAKFAKPTNAPWARLAIRPVDSEVASIGGPQVRYRQTGNLILEIFAPEGTGDGRARELADLACSIVRGREEARLRVWSARAIPLGVRDGWYRINVIAPYSWDEDYTPHS